MRDFAFQHQRMSGTGIPASSIVSITLYKKKAPPANSMLWVPAAVWNISLNPELAGGSSPEHAPSFQQLLFVRSP